MQKRGFTMVELMIVIAVISVLASIIIPKMSGARNKAALEACVANEKSLCLGAELYANDKNHCYPNAPFSPSGGIKLKNGNLLSNLGYIPPYPPRCANAPSGYYYWLASESPWNICFVWCSSPSGCHTILGVPASYPRYYSNRGAVKNP